MLKRNTKYYRTIVEKMQCSFNYFHLQSIETIDVGMPIICTSNFKLDSTLLDALWILNVNCQPLSKYNSKVFLLSGLNSKLTIRVGNDATGNFMLLLRFFPLDLKFLLNYNSEPELFLYYLCQ